MRRLRRGFDANRGPADGAEILLGVDPAPLRLTALAAPRGQRGLSGTPIAVARFGSNAAISST